MIYIFYTALTLAAILCIGTIKAQAAHIKGLKKMYRDAARNGTDKEIEVLTLNSKLRESNDVKQTWVQMAQDYNADLKLAHRDFDQRIEQLETELYNAQEYRRRQAELKKKHYIKTKQNAQPK